MAETVNMHHAKSSLSRLVARALAGEDVVIARNGTPVARLVRAEPVPKRRRGEWRDRPEWRNFVYDPTIFAPMTDEELREEGWE